MPLARNGIGLPKHEQKTCPTMITAIPRANIFEHFDPLYETIGLFDHAGATRHKEATRHRLDETFGLGELTKAHKTPRQISQCQYWAACRHEAFQWQSGRLPGWRPLGVQRILVSSDKLGLREVGQKGVTVFCQFEPGTKSKKIRPKDASAPILEIMASSGMTVLPPSQHPSGSKYRWHGKPLYEIDPSELPHGKCRAAQVHHRRLQKFRLHSPSWRAGAELKGHDLMLPLDCVWHRNARP